MMNRRTIDMWVGVFVVIGLGALLFLSLRVANLASFSAAESYQIKAKFDNIGGLKICAAGKDSGACIGRGNAVRF